MAYTKMDFYEDAFFGRLITESETFEGYAERASDWLDTPTFKRLVNGLPSDPWSAKRVQKCVCALAEAFYQLDIARDNAMTSMVGSSSSTDGGAEKSIKSVSSGSESVTYMTPAEIANGAKEWSVVYAAATSKTATNNLLMDTAREYLSGVTDDTGTNLLYVG